MNVFVGIRILGVRDLDDSCWCFVLVVSVLMERALLGCELVDVVCLESIMLS